MLLGKVTSGQHDCAIPENIHSSPTEGFFFLRHPPPTPLEIPIKLHAFL